ncbi:MAG: hypothetical protein RR998_02470 [Oscillospiraceae bacterium]
MKYILGFFAFIASSLCAFFITGFGLDFLRSNHRKYITLNERCDEE